MKKLAIFAPDSLSLVSYQASQTCSQSLFAETARAEPEEVMPHRLNGCRRALGGTESRDIQKAFTSALFLTDWNFANFTCPGLSNSRCPRDVFLRIPFVDNGLSVIFNWELKHIGVGYMLFVRWHKVMRRPQSVGQQHSSMLFCVNADL